MNADGGQNGPAARTGDDDAREKQGHSAVWRGCVCLGRSRWRGAYDMGGMRGMHGTGGMGGMGGPEQGGTMPMFEERDADKDGRVTGAEVTAHHAARLAGADADKDGKVMVGSSGRPTDNKGQLIQINAGLARFL